jgi:glycosyltransferase involved in cell wall biosynthesis
MRPPADDAEKRAIRAALNLPAEAFLILGVGTVYAHKGVDLLLEAWHRLVKRHPEVEIVWVGRRRDVLDPFQGPYNEMLEKLLQAGDAPGKVHMVGQSDEVDRYLKAADLFAFPSEREGMPNAVLEAAASQLPIVLTKYRGFSELIGKPGRDYVLIDRTVDAIEAAIEDLIENPGKRRELGVNARRFVEETMPLSRSIDMHVDVYRDVLGRLRP